MTGRDSGKELENELSVNLLRVESSCVVEAVRTSIVDGKGE